MFIAVRDTISTSEAFNARSLPPVMSVIRRRREKVQSRHRLLRQGLPYVLTALISGSSVYAVMSWTQPSPYDEYTQRLATLLAEVQPAAGPAAEVVAAQIGHEQLVDTTLPQPEPVPVQADVKPEPVTSPQPLVIPRAPEPAKEPVMAEPVIEEPVAAEEPVITEPEATQPVVEEQTGLTPEPKIEQAVIVTPPPVAEKPEKPVMETGNGSGHYFDSGEIKPRRDAPRNQSARHFVSVQMPGEALPPDEGDMVAANRALKLGRYDAAADMYERLRAEHPMDVGILTGLAIAQHKSGQLGAAAATYEEILKLDPDNTEVLVNLAGLDPTASPRKTYLRLERLSIDQPNNPGIAAQLGMISAQEGHYEDALAYLKKASTLDPNNAGHLYNMAVIMDRMGRGDGAISLYERALEVDAIYGASRSIPREAIYDRLSHLRRL